MMNRLFFHPQLLWLIPISLILVFLLDRYRRLNQEKVEKWIHASLWSKMIPDFSPSIANRRKWFLAFALFFLGLAYARPQWGEREESIRTKGMDVFFLLDLSNSMAAEDASPSRLARAQLVIKKALSELEGSRVGVIGFAGNADLAVPLTNDFRYVQEIVESLDPSFYSRQGTEVGTAIEMALKAFERSSENPNPDSKALVLISDGEDFGKNSEEFAKQVGEMRIGWATLSIGTTEGAPIPIRNEIGVLQTYKKDRSGKPILSKVNREYLAKLAEAGKGRYFEVINAEDSALGLSSFLKKRSQNQGSEQVRVTKIERYPLFLGFGILFLLLYFGQGYRRSNLIPSRKALLGVIVLVFCFPAYARDSDSVRAYLKNREGNQKFKKELHEDSAKSFQEAQSFDSENSTLKYNQGTALANAGKLEEAVSQLQLSTQEALAAGDYELAARSMFNEGLAQYRLKNPTEAYDRLTKAIDLAKLTQQKEVEKVAREQLVRIAKEEMDKEKNQQQNKDKDGDKGKDKDQDKGDKSKENEEDGENQNPQGVKEKREFRSGTLSKEVAEGIMNDLSDREKQLHQSRGKEKKGKEAPLDQDW